MEALFGQKLDSNVSMERQDVILRISISGDKLPEKCKILLTVLVELLTLKYVFKTLYLFQCMFFDNRFEMNIMHRIQDHVLLCRI